VLLCCLLLVPAAGFTATGDDFYQRLYQRGMTHFAAADYARAFAELRTAAFGFVEKAEQLELAESYASVAAHRLGRDSDARDSLMRIVSAEKLQPHYRSIKLPDDVRAEIAAIAANLLTAEEAALLGVTAAAKPAVDVPTPSKQPNVAVTAPRQGGDAGVPPAADAAPKPQPALPTPQDVDSSFADAQRAIDDGDIDRACSIYTEISSAPSLPHEVALRVAEGLLRVQDFAAAANAFRRAGVIDPTEERYRYDYAVALYETGRYGDAKRELAAALPYITMTPAVARYRAKIEAAIE
jgi:tetratricopeptide (TPR) repeat protein